VRRSKVWLFVCVLELAGGCFAQSKAPMVKISVDASEAPRKILHATLEIPVTPGALTLYYPQWIPGEHGPTGPINELAGLKFTGNGQPLQWRRDLLDGWTFHVDVPAGVSKMEVTLDFISPVGLDEALYTAGSSATDKMTVVSWNTVLLYPAGWSLDELTYEASLKLPAGWKFGTPLPIDSQAGDAIHFKVATLGTLVDSPVIAGEYLRVVPLAENPHQELDIAADSAAALNVSQDVLDPYKNLTDQAKKLFGAQHFRDYHFLYSLSDHVAHFGLEHHEADDSRVGERYLVDPGLRLVEAGLLPHEYVHSWNGKFRRPADLTTPDYEKPMQTDLLWVYEGLTSYLGDLLSGRSGIRTPEQYRDNLAKIAAGMDRHPGRTWRNLQDTADAAPELYNASKDWVSWRREVDFYDEDVLNWLWVDTIIRQQSHDKKSIDDFCHLFHGGPGGKPEIKTYTFEDVVSTLNQVVSYDWKGFWTERLTNHAARAPLDGIANSGWELVYDGTPSELITAWEGAHKQIDALYSVGLLVGNDGVIEDTVEGMVAAKAGIGPGMKIVAVNGRAFTAEVFVEGLRASTDSSGPLELLVENTDYFKTYALDYHGGEAYPHLVRIESKPDMLGEIIKPR
jgi:predicted metalloprotease with PDZ domain